MAKGKSKPKKKPAKKKVVKKPAKKKVTKKAPAKKKVAKKKPAKKKVVMKPAKKKAAKKAPAKKKPAKKKITKKAPAKKKVVKKPAKKKAAPKAVKTAKTRGKAAKKKAGGSKKARLTKEDLDYFKRILNEKRGRIIEKARNTLNEGMKLDEADLPDEYDMASSEYLQYFTLRLRGRERYFLDKIDKALGRIDEGAFGVCEMCGDDIGMARLMARPETTLCIRCKEAQEREERMFSD